MTSFSQPWAGLRKAGQSVLVLGRAGLFTAQSPLVVPELAVLLRQWGLGPAGGVAMMALRSPDGVGVIDEDGATTWLELHRRANSIARGLGRLGVGSGDRVGVLCRNHRGFLDAMSGAARVGADLYFLNTSMAGPQLRDVLAAEDIGTVIHDAEFAGVLASVGAAPGDDLRVRLVVSDQPDDRDGLGRIDCLGASLAGFVATESAADVEPPGRLSRIVLMTSGTTGVPKGAPRREAGPDAAVALLSRLPWRVGDRVHVAAPLFHTWGLAHALLALLLGHTLVLRRRFDPAETLRLLAEERCQGFVVVPVLLQRLLEASEGWASEELAELDLSWLRLVSSSGSALPGDLAVRWMDRFGENLHSTYGSTEVAYAAVAGPAELRADPSCAGRVPANTVVRILGPDDREVPAGESGRIFVGNSLLIPGYTHGGSKPMVDGLMESGDIGRMSADGVLTVLGRDDEMIVSGGENLYPATVENAVARIGWVREAAAIGVPDAEFGQRLVVFVALHPEAADAPAGPEQVELEVQQWVRERVARYAVPRSVVVVEELPRNATGKVMKRVLEVPGEPDRSR